MYDWCTFTLYCTHHTWIPSSCPLHPPLFPGALDFQWWSQICMTGVHLRYTVLITPAFHHPVLPTLHSSLVPLTFNDGHKYVWLVYIYVILYSSHLNSIILSSPPSTLPWCPWLSMMVTNMYDWCTFTLYCTHHTWIPSSCPLHPPPTLMPKDGHKLHNIWPQYI